MLARRSVKRAVPHPKRKEHSDLSLGLSMRPEYRYQSLLCASSACMRVSTHGEAP